MPIFHKNFLFDGKTIRNEKTQSRKRMGRKARGQRASLGGNGTLPVWALRIEPVMREKEEIDLSCLGTSPTSPQNG
jgi:hypothetical protein